MRASSGSPLRAAPRSRWPDPASGVRRAGSHLRATGERLCAGALARPAGPSRAAPWQSRPAHGWTRRQRACLLRAPRQECERPPRACALQQPRDQPGSHGNWVAHSRPDERGAPAGRRLVTTARPDAAAPSRRLPPAHPQETARERPQPREARPRSALPQAASAPAGRSAASPLGDPARDACWRTRPRPDWPAHSSSLSRTSSPGISVHADAHHVLKTRRNHHPLGSHEKKIPRLPGTGRSRWGSRCPALTTTCTSSDHRGAENPVKTAKSRKERINPGGRPPS
jgi:hypothetical protein